MPVPTDVRDALVWVRDDYADLVASAGADELGRPTEGTRWTNEQLLFHMWFGQRIARVVIPIMGGFDRLPDGVSRAWARMMSAVAGPYNWVNFAGSVAGARLVGPRVATRWMRRDTDAILGWIDRADETALARGMSVPPDWDPYFSDWMNRVDLLAWAPKHYSHHRRQLTLAASRL